MDTVIINGFDRCGSSMICRMLSKHPDVSMMFQPTNSTEVHRDLFVRWNPVEQHPETLKFYLDASTRRVYRDFIKAQWFDMYSKLDNLDSAKLLVIKETKLCFKMEWLRRYLPHIHLYGIWRSPYEMTNSLVRNNFHTDWYGPGRAFSEVLDTIDEDEALCETFAPLLKYVVDDTTKMAFIVAVSVFYLLITIGDPSSWLDFELIRRDPNRFLNCFLDKFSIDNFDFSEYIDKDYNVSGSNFKASPLYTEYFDPSTIKCMDRIFDPVLREADGLGLVI